MIQSPVVLSSIAAALCLSAAVNSHADSIDMDNPRRALGREDDIRVDAQILQDTVSASCSLTVTYQIQNESDRYIAVWDQVSDVNFDEDSRMIIVAIGSEIPRDGNMPPMDVIAPGETMISTIGAPVRLLVPSQSSPFIATPRYVQLKVSVLRDLVPFQNLLDTQNEAKKGRPLTDAQFQSWLEGSDTILLNPIPVHWNPGFTGGERRGR